MSPTPITFLEMARAEEKQLPELCGGITTARGDRVTLGDWVTLGDPG